MSTDSLSNAVARIRPFRYSKKLCMCLAIQFQEGITLGEQVGLLAEDVRNVQAIRDLVDFEYSNPDDWARPELVLSRIRRLFMEMVFRRGGSVFWTGFARLFRPRFPPRASETLQRRALLDACDCLDVLAAGHLASVKLTF